MNTNKKGFTLIELLVVIVIIGILATISVATFGGYFKKARDAERQSAVQNIATIMKVLNATEETVDYSVTDRDALDAKLQKQGYSTPDGKNNICYYYSYNTDKLESSSSEPANSEFFIGVASEEDTTKAFVAGTPKGVDAAPAGSDFPRALASGGGCTPITTTNGIPANMTTVSWYE